MKYRYPGLWSFTTDEKELFFGRKDDTEKLFRMISLNKITLLYSKSGLGKSSLINAGIIPEIEKHKNLEPIFVRLGRYIEGQEFSAVEIAARKINNEFNPHTFIDRILDNENSLWYHCKELQITRSASDETVIPYLLIFDQFEELFSYPEAMVNEFKKQLAELLFVQVPQRFRDVVSEMTDIFPDFLSEDEKRQLYKPIEIKVLFSIRNDRMSLLNQLTDQIPSILRTYYELQALSPEQARMAILEPAALEQATPKGDFSSKPFTYQTEAIENLINYLSIYKNETQSLASEYSANRIECFQLQLICQYAEKLMISENRNEITVEDLASPDQIFKSHYDSIINKIPENCRRDVRFLIEENLIIENSRIALPDIAIETKYKISPDLLAILENSRLLRKQPNTTGGMSYEISHDTLVAPILESRKIRVDKEEEEKAKRKRQEEEQQAERLRREEEERKERERREEKEQAERERKEELRIVHEEAEKERIKNEIEHARQEELLKEHHRQAAEAKIKILQKIRIRNLIIALAFVCIVFSIGGLLIINSQWKESDILNNGIATIDSSRAKMFYNTNKRFNVAKIYALMAMQYNPKIERSLRSIVNSPDNEGTFLFDKDNSSELKFFKQYIEIQYSDESKVLALADSLSAKVYLFKLKYSKPYCYDTLTHKGDVYLMAFNPVGTMLATVGYDNCIKIWEVKNKGKLKAQFQHQSNPITNVAYSPEGNYLAYTTSDSIFILDKNNKIKKKISLNSANTKMKDIASNGINKKEGKKASSKSNKGKERTSSNKINKICFHPDELYLYVLSDNKIINIYDLKKTFKEAAINSYSKNLIDTKLNLNDLVINNNYMLYGKGRNIIYKWNVFNDPNFNSETSFKIEQLSKIFMTKGNFFASTNSVITNSFNIQHYFEDTLSCSITATADKIVWGDSCIYTISKKQRNVTKWNLKRSMPPRISEKLDKKEISLLIDSLKHKFLLEYKDGTVASDLTDYEKFVAKAKDYRYNKEKPTDSLKLLIEDGEKLKKEFGGIAEFNYVFSELYSNNRNGNLENQDSIKFLKYSMTYINKALNFEPKNSLYYYTRGKVYFLKGVKDSAEWDFANAINHSEDSICMLKILREKFNKLDPNLAKYELYLLRSLLMLEPKNIDYIIRLSWFYILTGANTEAIDLLKRNKDIKNIEDNEYFESNQNLAKLLTKKSTKGINFIYPHEASNKDVLIGALKKIKKCAYYQGSEYQKLIKDALALVEPNLSVLLRSNNPVDLVEGDANAYSKFEKFDVYASREKRDSAFASLNLSLQFINGLYEIKKDDLSEIEKYKIARRYMRKAWYSIEELKCISALNYIEKGIKVDSTLIGLKMYKALALLINGETKKASALYEKLKDQPYQNSVAKTTLISDLDFILNYIVKTGGWQFKEPKVSNTALITDLSSIINSMKPSKFEFIKQTMLEKRLEAQLKSLTKE